MEEQRDEVRFQAPPVEHPHHLVQQQRHRPQRRQEGRGVHELLPRSVHLPGGGWVDRWSGSGGGEESGVEQRWRVVPGDPGLEHGVHGYPNHHSEVQQRPGDEQRLHLAPLVPDDAAHHVVVQDLEGVIGFLHLVDDLQDRRLGLTGRRWGLGACWVRGFPWRGLHRGHLVPLLGAASLLGHLLDGDRVDVRDVVQQGVEEAVVLIQVAVDSLEREDEVEEQGLSALGGQLQHRQAVVVFRQPHRPRLVLQRVFRVISMPSFSILPTTRTISKKSRVLHTHIYI